MGKKKDMKSNAKEKVNKKYCETETLWKGKIGVRGNQRNNGWMEKH